MEVTLADVTPSVLAELMEVATTDASAADVTPGASWTTQWITWLRDYHQSGSDRTWAVIDSSGSVLGSVRVALAGDGGDEAGDEAEIGIWLARSARGRGIGTSAVRQVVVRAFGLGASSIVAHTSAQNAGALGLLRSAGFALSPADADGQVEAELALRVSTLRELDARANADVAALMTQVSSRGGAVTSARVASVAKESGTCVLVARVNGVVVGAATLLTLTTLVGSFGYLEEVVVDAGSRGQGIGAALVSFALFDARSRGLDFVELTSRPSREAANQLYRSLGFTRRETNVYRYVLGTS